MSRAEVFWVTARWLGWRDNRHERLDGQVYLPELQPGLTCLEVVVVKFKAEIVNLLKQELNYLERGGYGGTLPWRPVSMFLDSPSCPNRLDADRSVPCTQCWLFLFVPEKYRAEMNPCHFIPLNRDGETVHTMSRQYTAAEVEATLKAWLEQEIRHLELADGESADKRKN